MSIPKRQHTIPRVYLENFTDSDGRLNTFSKRTKETLRPYPKDALVRKYYYSQPVDGRENADHNIETEILGGIETKYPLLYEQLIKGELDDVELMFETLAMMRSRSAAFREAFEIGLSDYVDTFLRSLPKSKLPSPPPNMPDILEKTNVTIDPHSSLRAMPHYLKRNTKCLVNCSYFVVRAPSGTEFLTSDNPVVWYQKKYGYTDKVVYPNEPTLKTRVVFPLNKKHALVGRPQRDNEPIFQTGIRSFSRKALREANEMMLGCAWDKTIGEIVLPSRIRDYYTALAPYLEISGYEPTTGSFELVGTTLKKIRSKHKYTLS